MRSRKKLTSDYVVYVEKSVFRYESNDLDTNHLSVLTTTILMIFEVGGNIFLTL